MTICSKKFFILIAVTLFVFSIGYPQSGGAPGEFLKLSLGARSVGMGGSAIGLIDDASSVFINPGMLGIVYDVNFNTTLGHLQFDRSYYDFSLAYPADWLGNFGVGLCQLGVTDISGRDQYGYFTQKFSSIQNAFVFGYSRMVGNTFSLGLSAKYLSHSLAGCSAKGTSFDAGLAVLVGDYITIGGVIQNVTSSLKWSTDSKLEEELPMKIGLGVSYFDPFGVPNLIVSSDIGMSNGEFSKYNFGAEYVIKNMFIVRGGYSNESYAFGGGVMYGGLKLDFAYTPEPFGGVSRLYFTLNWLISPGVFEYEEEPYREGVEPLMPEPEVELEEEKRSIVLITDGPLKFEKAEVIKTNVANNTVTVRLLAIPDSSPIILRMDQVRYIQ